MAARDGAHTFPTPPARAPRGPAGTRTRSSDAHNLKWSARLLLLLCRSLFHQCLCWLFLCVLLSVYPLAHVCLLYIYSQAKAVIGSGLKRCSSHGKSRSSGRERPTCRQGARDGKCRSPARSATLARPSPAVAFEHRMDSSMDHVRTPPQSVGSPGTDCPSAPAPRRQNRSGEGETSG